MNSSRCLFDSDIKKFLLKEKEAIFGVLCDKYHGDALTTTREAWLSEIDILQGVLIPWKESEGRIIFEYDIPRLGKRLDVVLLLNGIIFCLEFKVGETKILEGDVDQVLDYALDLKNFHRYSHDKLIVPILVATKYKKVSSVIQASVYNDRVVNPLVTGENGLQELITDVLKNFPNESAIDPNWIISPYAPTPTIIEAAKALYESHSVEDIGIHVLQSDVDNAVHQFLEDKADTRSSNYFEDAATEIQVQGLELDYTCLLWDADMRYDNGEWHYYKFNGKEKWNEVVANSESRLEQIKYMLNAYRVLLTRARSGMIICVPEGNVHKTSTRFWEDETRLPEYYNGTYEYLMSIGFEEIQEKHG